MAKRPYDHEGTEISNAVGALLIPQQGYLNNATATKDAITEDGWFKTGDIAIRDAEGYYYIVDRRKELIKYKVCLCGVYYGSILNSPPLVRDSKVVDTQQGTFNRADILLHSSPPRRT